MLYPCIDTSSAFHVESSTAMSVCETIDSPKSLALFMCLKHKEFDQVLDRSCDPLHYNDVSSFKDDYLVASLLKKSPNLPLTGVDPEQAAIDSFWESEQTCASLNKKLRSTEFIFALHETKTQVQNILGELSTARLAYVENEFRFGPGAQAFKKATGTTASDKFDKNLNMTASLIPFYRTVLGERWWEHQTTPDVVRGNEYTSVLKNAKTRRGICKEPALNSFMQLGVGKLFRSILKRNGIDLDSQLRNQLHAQRAYADHLATIDLSRASDSLARELVRELLARDWYQLVDICRSSSVYIEDHWHELEKFSSMGNGYTFELESLIFLAMARTCVPKNEWSEICVYGDDLIVPAVYADRLVDTLNSLGFEVNNEKSYLAGNFFESCGADFFMGQPVRPFYLRKDTVFDNGIPQTLQIANALRSYTYRMTHGTYCEERFKPLWLALVKRVPKQWRKHRGPTVFGDSVLLTSEEEAEDNVSEPLGGCEGRMVGHISLRPKKRLVTTFGALLYALRCAGTIKNATFGYQPISRLFGSPKTSRSLVHQWDHGLGWK